MPSAADVAGRAAIAGMLLLAACTGASPVSPTAVIPSASPTPVRQPGPSATGSPAATASPAGISLPAPGQPWDGAALLGEMEGSTRPGGVPSEARTPAVAEAIAQTVWTLDGTPWETMAIGGFCGPSICTLDIAGAHLGRAGEDLWTVEVDLSTGGVSTVVSDVRSLPWDLVDELDRLARSLDDDGDLGPMVLASARWLPPPAEPGRFVLSYRSGGEEGSCSREILIDADDGEIVERSASNC